ncbi:MAG: Uma2 family endonuclease [Acidobacteriota bacterium]
MDALPDDGNRYELIEGELLVTRAPRLNHQGITSNLILAFGNHLKKFPEGKIYPTPGVIFSVFDAVIPDLVFISYERLAEISQDEKLCGAPELIIEILSPGTENAKRDRQIKRQLYRKYSVQEYWLVDPETTTSEIYRSPKFNQAKLLTLNDMLTTPLLPQFHCPAHEVFE